MSIAYIVYSLFKLDILKKDFENLKIETETILDTSEQFMEEYKNIPYRNINLSAICQVCNSNQIIELNEEMMFNCKNPKCGEPNSIIIEVKSFGITTPLESSTGFKIDNDLD